MKNKLRVYLWCVVMAILLALLLREAWVIVVEHIILPDWQYFSWDKLSWPNLFKQFNIGLYWWFAIGFFVYLLTRKFLVRHSRTLRSTFNFMETLSHEFSHTLVGILTGRRVQSFHVEENTGQVVTSGSEWNRPFVSLAPYTLPFLTYIALALRTLIAWHNTWLFDILIGMTLGFHLVCFARETRLYQTDINRFPSLWFPLMYIALWTVFNFNVIAVSFWSSKNVFTALWWVLQHIFVW